MGAWGTSLYANDTTSDIRGDYLDKLRRGQTNEEVTKALIEKYQDIMGDAEEEPLFWYALADTQFNYGRLLPEVKAKALYFLSQTAELERWRESGEKQLNAWKATLAKLKDKLNSSQPPEKKVYKYRLYQCKWQLGDVFAYRFSGEYSKERGVFGQYIVFRKITEDICWPGHMVPAVNVYKWLGSEIPSLDSLKGMERLVANCRPVAFINYPDLERRYLFAFLVTSEKSIPKDNLTFLGNLPGDDLFPYPGPLHSDERFFFGSAGPKWWDFEKAILEQYFAWAETP